MKNQFFLIGLIGVFLVFSIAIKFANGIMAGSITTFLIFLLVIIFLTIGIKSFFNKQLNKLSIIFIVFSNMIWTFSTIAIYFKIQLFPNSNLLLSISLAGIVLNFIFYFREDLKNSIPSLYKNIGIPIVFLIFIISLLFVPSNTLIDIYYRNDLKQGELIKKMVAEPNNKEIIQEVEDYQRIKN